MTQKTPAPGIFKDPWRSQPEPEKQNAPNEPPATVGHEGPDADFQEPKFAVIEVKNYGGITVGSTDNTKIAAAQILQFCIDHQKDVDPILTEYGLVLAKVQPKKIDLKFYVHRQDGWMLAVPGVDSRDAGCLQLIQAMLKIQLNPALKRRLEQYEIWPYKM